MENKIMFYVQYNPITKSVIKGNNDVVFDYPTKESAESSLPEGCIVMVVTDGVYEGTLNYCENFCCCDKCGKMFLQDDLHFTDEGSPLCYHCVKYDTYFQINGLDIVSRGDYESMPCPMYAGEFDDDQMYDLAETIYLALSNYGFEQDDLVRFFTEADLEYPYLEDINAAFWTEMEEIAVAMGMRYYEDMSDEEYKRICENNH
jgi:hypothetical protein